MDKQEPRENVSNTQIVCYAPTLITTNGIWQGDNPLAYSLPLFILQLTLVVLTTRTLVFVLKPLRQPRVIAEIIVSDDPTLPASFSSSSFFYS